MWTYQMNINQRNREYLRDRNVRRAMAAVINTEDVITNWGSHRSIPIERQSAADPGTDERLMSDALDDFIDYAPKDSDHDKADTFLEQSGFSRQNGTVVDSDGQELETLRYITITDHLFTVPSETIVAQMQEYGFPIDYTAMPASEWANQRDQQTNKWDLTMNSLYAGDFHFSSFYDDSPRGYRLSPSDVEVQKYLDQDLERSPYTGREFVVEVPTEIGQMDLSGETEQLNIRELYKRARAPGVPQEEVTKIHRKLNWYWNFAMVNPQVLVPTVATVGNTRDYTWPDEETLIRYDPNSPYRAIHEGSVTIKDS
jgi:hypothetical protein